MSAVGLFLAVLFLAVVICVLVLLGVALLLPAVSEAEERARVEREAQEASWRIHQHATQAMGQMLSAARDSQAGSTKGRRS